MVVVMMTIASLQFRWVCRRPPALSGSNPGAAWPCVGPEQTILIFIMMMIITLMMNIIIVVIMIDDCNNDTVEDGYWNHQCGEEPLCDWVTFGCIVASLRPVSKLLKTAVTSSNSLSVSMSGLLVMLLHTLTWISKFLQFLMWLLLPDRNWLTKANCLS